MAIGCSVLVALCLMIQKVWKWVKSFMIVTVDFSCCVYGLIQGFVQFFMMFIAYRLYVETSGWIRSHDSMLRPRGGFLEWCLGFGRLVFCYYVLFYYTLPPFTLHTLPPKNSVECSHQVFKWSHLRICCNILSKK